MSSQRAILVYDGGCGMCRRTVRTVKLFDWLRRIDCAPFEEAAARYPEVAASALEAGVRIRFPDTSMNIGIDAVRSVMMRTPVGALVGWILYVPGIHWLGDRAYRWVAARRSTTTCRVPAA